MTKIPPVPHFDAWRIFRIISEFVDGFETMTHVGPSVSIFGTARASPESKIYQLASQVAEKISKKGFAIITGGGPGVMEAANKGAKKAGGISCGVSINLPTEPRCNDYIDSKYNIHFRYFFVRKVMFVRYAQAFVVLPGGFGTLDELFEALTLIQTKKIRSFPIFLMGKDYWSGLIDWLEKTVLAQSHIKKEDFSLFTLTDDPDEVAEAVERHFKSDGDKLTFDLFEGKP